MTTVTRAPTELEHGLAEYKLLMLNRDKEAQVHQFHLKLTITSLTGSITPNLQLEKEISGLRSAQQTEKILSGCTEARLEKEITVLRMSLQAQKIDFTQKQMVLENSIEAMQRESVGKERDYRLQADQCEKVRNIHKEGYHSTGLCIRIIMIYHIHSCMKTR